MSALSGTYLIDTCVWSALIRRSHPRLNARFASLAPSQVHLSAVVWGELLVGYYKGDQTAQREEVLRKIAANSVPQQISHDVARTYAQLRAKLERAGQPIGRNDTWIAAEALHHGLTLITDNTHEFSRVEGLAVENWLE